MRHSVNKEINVRIIKSTHRGDWYHDKIGNIYTVVKVKHGVVQFYSIVDSKKYLLIVTSTDVGKYLLCEDCETIEESRDRLISEILK